VVVRISLEEVRSVIRCGVRMFRPNYWSESRRASGACRADSAESLENYQEVIRIVSIVCNGVGGRVSAISVGHARVRIEGNVRVSTGNTESLADRGDVRETQPESNIVGSEYL